MDSYLWIDSRTHRAGHPHFVSRCGIDEVYNQTWQLAGVTLIPGPGGLVL